MRLIDEFVTRVMQEESSFLILSKEENKKDTKYYHFLQSKVGKARYIYGKYSWNDERFYSKIHESDYFKYALVAIVLEDNIYICDKFFFDMWHGAFTGELPMNAREIFDVVKDKNKYVSEVVFPQFYDSLETFEIEDEETLKECKISARKILLSRDVVLENEILKPMFNGQDIADMFCGFIELDEEIQKRLNEEKETWVFKKSFNLKVKDFMEHPQTVAQDYELAIAKGFRSVNAKTVTVEFEFKGKTGVAKIDVDKILRNLVDNEYFSDFNFVTQKSGKELFESLGASDSIYDEENHLKCEHISKITYGKKELYVKK